MVERNIAKPEMDEPAPTKKKNQKETSDKNPPESPKTRATNMAKKEVE